MPTATGSPIVNARMDGDIVSDTGPGAASLEVRALGVDKAKATAQAVSKGLGADSDNESEATVSPTLDAHIGGSSRIDVSGNITVEAKDNPEADAATKGVAKGSCRRRRVEVHGQCDAGCHRLYRQRLADRRRLGQRQRDCQAGGANQPA